MAHFEKRGKKWRAQVSWYDIHGKRKFKTKQGFLTKSQARKWADEMEVAKDDNLISAKDPVFADYYDKWYQRYKAPGKSRGTQNRYKHTGKLIKAYFGNIRLSKITRGDYQDFMNKYGKDHAKETVRKVHYEIRTSIKDAISEGLLHNNFTDRINLTWNDTQTRKIEYLNFKQLQAFKKSLLDGINPRYTSRYMLLTIIYTGMRPGEIRVLTWNDIDFKNKTININKSWNYDNRNIKDYDSDEINGSTKNYSSTRVIKVDQKLLDILQQLKVNNHKHIFIDQQGTIPTSNAVDYVLRERLNKLGIHKKNFHFHSLRHTHVAMLLFKGVGLYSVSKRLGHASIITTAKTYAYFMDELKQKSDKRITSILDKI